MESTIFRSIESWITKGHIGVRVDAINYYIAHRGNLVQLQKWAEEKATHYSEEGSELPIKNEYLHIVELAKQQ